MQGSDKHSAVISMASYYSTSPASSMPLYSSCKSFNDVISQCMHYENQEMDILTVKNMPTQSERHPLGVAPADTVQGVFLDLGHERISYGHYKHSLLRPWILFQQSHALWNKNSVLGKMVGMWTLE